MAARRCQDSRIAPRPAVVLRGSASLAAIAANSLYLLFAPFDPYPYILLNLALSLLAAIQAPIIMMSRTGRKRATACAPRTIIRSI
jgi:uncharacterized membrane protein